MIRRQTAAPGSITNRRELVASLPVSGLSLYHLGISY
jgi:hypothetical protein